MHRGEKKKKNLHKEYRKENKVAIIPMKLARVASHSTSSERIIQGLLLLHPLPIGKVTD